MRVLSIPQPWAHLVVRGLKHVEVRTWTTRYRGRIAIHASAAVPSRDIESEWLRDEKTARVFADQGWRSRADLTTLPRAAIVGTVELRSVHLGKALHDQYARPIPRFDFDEALYAALGRVGGGFGWTEPRIAPVPVVIPDDQYAWAFGYPCAIEPLEGVAGQQHLWSLARELAGEVEERERRATSGGWRMPPVDAGKRRRAMADWSRVWDKVYEDLAWKLLIEAFWEIQVEHVTFDDEDVEKQFRRTMKKWLEQYGVAVPGAGLHVAVEPRLRKWFGGREVVRALEFEATVRWEMQEQLKREVEDARTASHLKQIVELLRELKARAARKPISNAAIAKRVKDEYKRLFEEGVQREMGELRE